ncbi:MAG: hypothetical protein FJW23_10845 [Acidimicrobiia bacterium]|nr:hypothetical protein [Acidimicrobiia bacterium]
MKTLLKIVAGLAALGVLGVLFVRSAQSSRSEPFTVAAEDLTGWTLTLAPNADVDALLSLTPPPTLMPPLADALFARMGESLRYPPASLPLVLRSEFDQALGPAFTPEALLELARNLGLESATFRPTCMAQRRMSAPGVIRGIYFLVFDVPPFASFREQVAQRLRAGGGDGARFDPAALSPVILAAGLDGGFRQWMPLAANTDEDCFAPVAVE